jgi:putative PIN family toxin of toxin-antitoxin system
MRAVLDTTTVVAAIRSDAGASHQLLRAALERRAGFAPLVSVPLLLEYEAVLTRAEHLKAAGLSVADIEMLLDALAAVSEPVQLAYLWRPTLRDANDDMVLEAAVNGRADAIITFNLRDFSLAGKHFGLSILFPHEALIRLEKRS